MGAKDITEKQLADYNDVFADIINGVLFDGEQIVSENELQNVKDKSQYKFNNKIHEQERDISKRWIPHKICFALYGLEHQTDAEPYAPIRIIGYPALWNFRKTTRNCSTKRLLSIIIRKISVF